MPSSTGSRPAAAATAEVIQDVSAGRTGTGWTPAGPASSRPGVAGGARGGTDHAARRGTGEAPRSCMPAPGASPTRARPARPASRALALFSTEKQCRCPLFRRGCVMSLEGCCTWQPPAPMLPADPRYPCPCVASFALCHKCPFPHAMCHQRTVESCFTPVREMFTGATSRCHDAKTNCTPVHWMASGDDSL
jgi:hypothetical protein